MKIKDQITTLDILQDKEERTCPPHRLGHLSLTTDEPCHFHTSLKHQYLHHLPFCYLIKCPNRKYMQTARSQYKNSKE